MQQLACCAPALTATRKCVMFFCSLFFRQPNQHLWSSFPNSKGFSTFSHTTVSAYDYYVEPRGVESDKKKKSVMHFRIICKAMMFQNSAKWWLFFKSWHKMMIFQNSAKIDDFQIFFSNQILSHYIAARQQQQPFFCGLVVVWTDLLFGIDVLHKSVFGWK